MSWCIWAAVSHSKSHREPLAEQGRESVSPVAHATILPPLASCTHVPQCSPRSVCPQPGFITTFLFPVVRKAQMGLNPSSSPKQLGSGSGQSSLWPFSS